MKKQQQRINIFGDITSESGYSIHCRELGLALARKGLNVAWDSMVPNWDSFNDETRALNKPYEYASTIMISTPENWSYKSGDRVPVIGFGVFEGTQISLTWEIACKRGLEENWLKEIWTPSNHTKQSFIAGNIPESKLHIVPHGVDEKVFNANYDYTQVQRVDDNDNFKFSFVGGWRDGIRDRKGLDILLRAFCAEFKKEEKVELNAKINMAYQDGNTVIRNVEALQLPPKDTRAKINLIMSQMGKEQLANFYRDCDVFVMPSKGEAFCMPTAEAMACSCYPIATKYGGQEDYMAGYGAFIKTEKMIPATADLYYERALWALPSQKSLQEEMRFAYDNPNTVKKVGTKASKHILKNYKWSDSASKAIKRLKALDIL